MHSNVSALLAIVCAGAVATFTAVAAEAPYPARPIRIIVTSAPGGGSDFMGRLAAQKLMESVGQQVVVENRPGIATHVGNEYGMGATPDGYTMTIVTPSYTINPSLRTTKFDPLTSYTPVIMLGKAPTLLLVHPGVAATSARDLLALAKSQKSELAYGSSGQGTIIHMTTELFLLMGGIRMLHVPYKGGGLALLDVMSGRIQVVFSPPQSGMAYVRSGKLKALGMSSSERMKSEPDIPTIAESGVPGYEATNWHALIAPKGLPRGVQQRLNSEMRRIVASSEFLQILQANGVEPAGGSPEQLHEYVRADFYKWQKVIRAANIRVE